MSEETSTNNNNNTSSDIELVFELVDYSKPDLHRELMHQFLALCSLEFSGENEMERLDVWEHMLSTRDRSRGYQLTFTVALNKNGGDGKILGGCQQEFYFEPSTALLPYVVVSKNARGTGLAKKLVKEAYNFLAKQAIETSNGEKPLREMFIELSQKSDARDDGNPYHSVEQAEIRHKVWGKIGFVGLEFSFFHPGYLRNTEHQLAVYRPGILREESRKNTEEHDLRPVPAETVSSFISSMFMSIAIPEGKAEETKAELAKTLPEWIAGRSEISVGKWR